MAVSILPDGGMETDLIFHRGLDLPLFASFVLLDDPETEEVVRDYFRDYLRIAAETGHGLVLETRTWRASHDWATQLGYDDPRLADVNRRAVQCVLDLRQRQSDVMVVVSGCAGPRGDAYADLGPMTVEEAADYHVAQISVLTDCGVDLVSALTLTNIDEAIGVVHAARASGVPVVISFTVETNGAVPTGMALAEAVQAVDDATDGGPAYLHGQLCPPRASRWGSGSYGATVGARQRDPSERLAPEPRRAGRKRATR